MNTHTITRIYVRLPNWIGDVCMSLPSVHALIATGCEVVLCAKPWAYQLLMGLVEKETKVEFVPFCGKWHRDARTLKAFRKDHPCQGKEVGLLLPDSLTSALAFKWAGLSCCGYKDDGRSFLLRWPVHKPEPKPHAVQSWYHLTKTALKTWGFDVDEAPRQRLELPLPLSSQQAAKDYMDQFKLTAKHFILIAPTATGLHKGRVKVWPYYRELSDQLSQRGYRVVMCPPSNEKAQALQNAPTTECLPPLGLDAFIALIEQASLVICNDSGVAHLCATTTTPQITLIGVTNPQRTGPWSSHAHILGQEGRWPTIQEVVDETLSIVPTP